MSQDLLVVRVSHGLCNRLRVLLSAIAFCELTGRRLLVHWPLTRRYRFALSDLWRHSFAEIGQLRWQWLKLRAGGFIGAEQMRPDLAGRIVCLRTMTAFLEDAFPRPSIEYLDRLEPVESIRLAIERTAAAWPSGVPIVGASVRSQQAHEDTARHSPPEWFIARMNAIVAAFPGTEFFLSADTRDVVERIRAGVSAPVHALDKTYEYNRPNGVREAVCDLYLLARTRYVLASHFSSFSDTACAMRGEDAFETSLQEKPPAQLARFLG